MKIGGKTTNTAESLANFDGQTHEGGMKMIPYVVVVANERESEER